MFDERTGTSPKMSEWGRMPECAGWQLMGMVGDCQLGSVIDGYVRI